jgi:hypothetical protein
LTFRKKRHVTLTGYLNLFVFRHRRARSPHLPYGEGKQRADRTRHPSTLSVWTSLPGRTWSRGRREMNLSREHLRWRNGWEPGCRETDRAGRSPGFRCAGSPVNRNVVSLSPFGVRWCDLNPDCTGSDGEETQGSCTAPMAARPLGCREPAPWSKTLESSRFRTVNGMRAGVQENRGDTLDRYGRGETSKG